MKAFTLWTRKVRFDRCPVNNWSFFVIVIDRTKLHTVAWIAIQPGDNRGMYSSYLTSLSASGISRGGYGCPDYTVL